MIDWETGAEHIKWASGRASTGKLYFIDVPALNRALEFQRGLNRILLDRLEEAIRFNTKLMGELAALKEEKT